MTGHSKDISPVGWYVGSYLLRFIERDDADNDDMNRKFLAWENTVIVQAGSLDEAYAKITRLAGRETSTYTGGMEAVPVQWVLEGLTELLPIYEPLEDGAEIMWAKHDAVKLSELRRRTLSLTELKVRLSGEPDVS
jgi:hypothetical protein